MSCTESFAPFFKTTTATEAMNVHPKQQDISKETCSAVGLSGQLKQ